MAVVTVWTRAVVRLGVRALLVLVLAAATATTATAMDEDPLTFDIKAYQVSGNTVLTETRIQEALGGLAGTGKNIEQIQMAADWLQNVYRDAGYPTVIVNIPEQEIVGGVVRLEVVERKIRKVRITGNRYNTMEKILRELPSLNPGKLMYLPQVKQELRQINLSRDLKVTPFLKSGKKPDTVDLELKIEDRLPVHGSLELNNRNSVNTSDLRLNASLSYTNLWQRDHAVSLQYQTSPENTSEVQVMGLSYSLPAPWDDQQTLVLYGISSDSQVGFGTGFQVVGDGEIFGGRLVMPLPGYEDYSHSLLAGIDYKNFDEDIGGENGGEVVSVEYLPMSLSYSARFPDRYGRTYFSAGANLAFRGVVTRQEEFANKRFRARGNYLYVTGGVERRQELPWQLDFYAKADGQLSSQPLISNEQYTAGGMESVRGYYEAEESGDDAWHMTFELRSSALNRWLGEDAKWSATPYVFYDLATLYVQDPLPDEEDEKELVSMGAGLRGFFYPGFEFGLDWAYVLSETTETDKGDQRVHFKIKYAF